MDHLNNDQLPQDGQLTPPPDVPQPGPQGGGNEFELLMEATSGDFNAKLDGIAQADAAEAGLGTKAADLGTSVLIGAVKPAFEFYDFVTGGDPNYEDKTSFRRNLENYQVLMDRKSAVNAVGSDVAQFVSSWVGIGKITKLLAPAKAAGVAVNASGKVVRGTAGASTKTGKVVKELAKGAAAGGLGFDPHEQRVSDLIETVPALRNPVTEYLQSDLKDSDAEGRLKSALEGIGLDVALAGATKLALKAFKLRKAGNVKAAEKVEDEAGITADMPGTEASSSSSFGKRSDAPWDVVVPAKKTEKTATLAEDTGIPKDEPSISETVPVGQAPTITDASQAAGFGKKVKPAEEMVITDDEVKNLLASHGEDTAMLVKYGSRDGAEAAGHRFAEETIPWRKIAGTDGLATFIQRTAAVKADEFAKIKGGAILSDARVLTQARQYAEVFGVDPTLVMGNIQAAGKEAPRMAAQMEAGFAVSSKLFAAAYDTSMKLREGNWMSLGYASEDAAHNDFKRLLGMASETAASTRSLLSNAARTVRRARFGISEEAMKALQAMDPKAAIEAMAATGGDLKQVARVATPSLWKRIQQEGATAMVSGLMWSPRTHIVNFVGNLMMLGVRPAEKFVGASVLRLAGKNGAKSLQRRAMLEYRYTLASVGDGIKEATDAFKLGDSTIAPHEFLKGEDVPTGALKNLPKFDPSDITSLATYAKFANGLSIRATGAVDAGMKTLRYRAYVQAQAADTAEQLGLTGDAFKAHVREAMDSAFDESGRALHAEALQEARVSTFSDQLTGPFTSRVQQLVADNPGLRAFLTFVKTPFKLFGYGVRLTPGLNLLHGEFLREIRGAKTVEQQAQAIGQLSLGALVASATTYAAIGGHITGGGPDDPASRRELTKSGWQPYSWVTVNKDGSRTFTPLSRFFDPIGMVMGMAADAVDITNHPERMEDGESAFMAIAVAAAKNVKNRTFMQSLSNALDAFSEPEGNLPKWAAGVGEAMIPFGGLLKAVNGDEYIREARGFIDNMRDRMPGSKSLPPLRDAYGDPITVYKGLWATHEADAVDMEMERLIAETGRGISKVSASADQVDLRDLMVVKKDGSSTTAYDEMLENMARPGGGAKPLKKALLDVIRSKNYLDAPDGESDLRGTKLWMLSSIRSKYREAAYKRLLREHPEVASAVQKRKMEVRESWRRTKQKDSRAPSIQGALEALGAGQQ